MTGSIKKQLLTVACANLGLFMNGLQVGWTSPIIPKLQDPEQTPLPDVITDFEASVIGSLLLGGAILGPNFPSYLSNIVGRKPCLLFGGLLHLIAIILIITTKNISMIYAIRIFSGLAMGVLTVGNLVYMGEIASTHIRGIILITPSISCTLGILTIYAIGPFVSYQATGYFSLVFGVIYVIGLLFIPESPFYFAIKGKEKEAKETLRYLGRLEDLDNVFESVRGTNPKEANSWKAWVKIFTVKSNRQSLFITLSLCTLQHTSGVTVVLFFATTIFQLSGTSIRPDLATIIVGVVRMVAILISPMVVERAGRRFLLMISTAFCAISLSLLGGYFYMARIKSPLLESASWLPLLALILYCFFYELGFGNIPFVLVGEMFRGNARSTGSSISLTVAWICGFGITTIFGTIVKTLGGDVTFWFFAVSCIIAFLFTYKFVPETKGKTLNEIQKNLGR